MASHYADPMISFLIALAAFGSQIMVRQGREIVTEPGCFMHNLTGHLSQR
jgi:hypothetical protein